MAGQGEALAVTIIDVFAVIDDRRNIFQTRTEQGRFVEDTDPVVLDALRPGIDLGHGEVGHQPDFADAGRPPIRPDAGKVVAMLLGQVAVIVIGIEDDQAALAVERQAGAQVDRAGDAAFDHVGRLVLVGIDTGHQFRRHVTPRQAARRVGVERIAAVEFRADLLQAANQDARRLGGEVGGVRGASETGDRDAGDALQRLGHRLVGEGSDVVSRDRIHDGVGATLQLLRRLQRLSLADNNHFGARRRRVACRRRCRRAACRRILGQGRRRHGRYGDKRGGDRHCADATGLRTPRRANGVQVLHCRNPLYLFIPQPRRRLMFENA